MKNACETPGHPRGTLGRITRVTPKAVYRERICPECGRVQGIARIRREAS